MTRRLELTRSQILAFRRNASALDERLPAGVPSLRRAAWAGLQDSMPRAALLSIHARVEGTKPDTWEHSALVQIWGPRWSAYVVAKRDLPVFTLGRLAEKGPRRALADDLAAQLAAFLDGRRMLHRAAGKGMRERDANRLRYAAPTGTVLIRWDGARDPLIWSVPRPTIDPRLARLELARRYLHIFGPTTASAFAVWAGIVPADGVAAFDALARSLVAVRTPIGDAWILASDEDALRARARPAATARLLPSGDTYYLLQGADRALLVPGSRERAKLWTTRVWPGALLVRGEVAGTWRRGGADVVISPWRAVSRAERAAVEAEAMSLPLPGVSGGIRVRWEH